MVATADIVIVIITVMQEPNLFGFIALIFFL